MNAFRKYVLRNFGLKVLSLIFAIGLWAAVAHEPMAEIVLNVPVEFHSPPENLEISSQRVPEAQVRVRGAVSRVRQLAPAEVHAIVNLAGIQPGERTFDLNPSRIGVPDGVEVVQVVPTQFRISMDRRLTREVPVHPRVTGTLASGYHIVKVTTDPEMVMISGPARHVQEVDAAITDPIDATGVVGTDTFTSNAYVTDPMVRVATSGPIRVIVQTQSSQAR